MTQTPAGWYPDETGQRRWWDGNQWTEHVDPGTPGAAAGQPAAQPGAAQGYGDPAAGAPGQQPMGQWPPTAYLDGAPSDFQGAVRDAIANLTEFRGRASRSSYWWFYLAQILIVLPVYVIFLIASAASDALGALLGLVLIVAYIVLLLANIAVGIRRLHDTNRSAWWLLIGLIPCGGFVLLVFFLLEGTQGPNDFNIRPDGSGRVA